MQSSLSRAGHSVLLSPNNKFVPPNGYIENLEKKRNQDIMAGTAA
jgi:hypothetical protein